MEDRKLRLVNHLQQSAWLLERGEPVQVTRLRVLNRLVDSPQLGRQFSRFLLSRGHARLLEGRSLSRVQLVSPADKERLFRRVLDGLDTVERFRDGVIRAGTDLIDLYRAIEALSPGSKRISVHASRRKLKDPDLALIETIVLQWLSHRLQGDWAYFAARYYCCDYADLRFRLGSDSAPRIADLVNFFEQRGYRGWAR